MIPDQTVLELPAKQGRDNEAVSSLPAKRPRNSSGPAPTDADRIADKLTWLRLLVMQRDADLVDHQAQNIAYVQLLLDYPADLVVSVIDAWPRQSKFWPTWLELEEAIKTATGCAETSTVKDIAPGMDAVRFRGLVIEFYKNYARRNGLNWIDLREEVVIGSQAFQMKSGKAERVGIERVGYWTKADVMKRLGLNEAKAVS